MTWPADADALESAGYVLTGRGECSGCGAPILWATTPSRGRMPLSVAEVVAGVELYRAHFADCPQAERFRKRASVRKAHRGGPRKRGYRPARDDQASLPFGVAL